ncbi:LytTR family DNA-binding domain-containing protein [Cyclobacterium sp. 1_MG-2023]|uniref:LytR/AlgR family response regulator transcription factor n=1 Tax=Cyclobacterium sp. 1_MG-2023 TaxID=3062681 RepID=UPI0026E43969|nr:LytTR family DNA-binding domain-containing protein [Cyclobacterium sp. 1_MG-2023]MDO6436221.1 LytTR family DNA-binding domain-containing protein [Cyclobacterium sp. 1_MG-2023]
MKGIKTCIIVDDEPAAHYVLINYINQNPRLNLVFQAFNAIEAMNYIRENSIDLMFLDINMPEISGIDMLKILSSPPQTILTTAYSEFALESYEYGVLDYLLKPIDLPRFLKATERFFALESPVPILEKNWPQSITVKVDGEFKDIKLQKLNYIQSFGNYVKIHKNQKVCLGSISTTEFEKLLPEESFIRIHKSYIVAIDKIKNIDKDFVEIEEEKLPIGITYKRQLFDRLKIH